MDAGNSVVRLEEAVQFIDEMQTESVIVNYGFWQANRRVPETGPHIQLFDMQVRSSV